jgi:hypothetical protein
MSLEIIKEALGILDTIAKLPTGAITFTNAITTIFQVISAILQADGKEGWSTIANEAIGKGALTLEDEKDLKPLTDLLIQLKYANKDTPLENLQKGGGASINPNPDLNKLFAKGVNKFKEVNKTVNDFSSTFGITKFERIFDRLADPKPLLPLGAFPAVRATGLQNLPVPFRFMIFFLYSVLHIVRLVTSDVTIIRKVLSVVLAILELLRGDWKTSLLAFAGFFGSGLVYTGFVYKIFLEIFYMISPPLQNDIVFGAYRVTKSILIGFLLNIFKITATYTIRTQAIKLFERLIAKEEEIDAVLEEKGFLKRGYMNPDDPQEGVHEYIEDATWNCSSEFQDAIKIAKENSIMRVILQLCNIPTSEDDQECAKFAKYAYQQGYKTWAELLREEGLLKLMDADDLPSPPGSDGPEAPEGMDPAETAEYTKIQKEIHDLRKEWNKAMDKEEAAERKMLEALAKLAPSTKSATPTSVPSPGLPIGSPIGSPIHVDISWAAQQAAAAAAATDKDADADADKP